MPLPKRLRVAYRQFRHVDPDSRCDDGICWSWRHGDIALDRWRDRVRRKRLTIWEMM